MLFCGEGGTYPIKQKPYWRQTFVCCLLCTNAFTFIRRNRSFKMRICCLLGFLEGPVKSAGTKPDIWNYHACTRRWRMPCHLSCTEGCIPRVSVAVSPAAWFSVGQREQESSLALHLCFLTSSLHLSVLCRLGFLQQIYDALEYSRRFTCFHGRTICT